MTAEPTPHASRQLTANEAAEYVGLSAKALANYRCAGGGPVFYKVGRYVRYEEADLSAWVRSRRFTSTSQASAR